MQGSKLRVYLAGPPGGEGEQVLGTQAPKLHEPLEPPEGRAVLCTLYLVTVYIYARRGLACGGSVSSSIPSSHPIRHSGKSQCLMMCCPLHSLC